MQRGDDFQSSGISILRVDQPDELLPCSSVLQPLCELVAGSVGDLFREVQYQPNEIRRTTALECLNALRDLERISYSMTERLVHWRQQMRHAHAHQFAYVRHRIRK